MALTKEEKKRKARFLGRPARAKKVGTKKATPEEVAARELGLRKQQAHVTGLSPRESAKEVRATREGDPIRNLRSAAGQFPAFLGAQKVSDVVTSAPVQAVKGFAEQAGSLVADVAQPVLEKKAEAARESKQRAIDVLNAKKAARGGPVAGSRFQGEVEALRGADSAQRGQFDKMLESLKGASVADNAAQKRGLRFLGLSHADQFAPGGKEDPMTERNRAMREARTMGDKEALRDQFRSEALQDVRRGEDRGQRAKELGLTIAGDIRKAMAGDALKREEFANNLRTSGVEAQGQALEGVFSNPDSSAAEKMEQAKFVMDATRGDQAQVGGQGEASAAGVDLNGDDRVDSNDDNALKTAQTVMTRFAQEEDPAKKAAMQTSPMFIKAQAIIARMKKKAAAEATRVNV